MSRRRTAPVLTASIVLAVGLTAVLAACSGPDGTPSPSASTTASRSASPTPTSNTTASPSAPSVPGDDQTGPADDGTGAGTGNGSGVDQPSSVDFAKISAQGVAAAGDGTVVALSGAGDNWTVVVSGPDGSQTQAVVSATLDRVTSGPFPKDVDAATKSANVSRTAALKVDAAAAAAAAERTAAGGTLSALTLGGSGSAPVWTATVTVGGASKTVTVNGVTGAAS